MKDNCIIKITDLQITDDNEDCVEITTRGHFRNSEDGFLLDFEEIFEDNLKSRTSMTVQPGCVKLVRQGEICTEIIIENGKRHNCHYLTPYGELMVGIFAKEIENSVQNGEGRLRMLYTVDFYGTLTATKEMNVEINRLAH